MDDILSLLESGAHFVRCDSDKKAISGVRWSEFKPTLADVVAHVGLIGLVPVSIGTVCIDVDNGSPDGVIHLCKRFDVAFRTVRTPRGWHIWVKSPAIAFGNGKWSYAGATGCIRSAGGYAILWNPAQIVRLVDDHDAFADRAFFAELTISSKEKNAKCPTNTVLPGLARPGRQSESALRPPAGHYTIDRAGYYTGNRSNQLNCDVWYLTLYGYSIQPAVTLARESGLPEDKIAYDVACTQAKARKHWFYRLRSGEFDPQGLTKSHARVLQALGFFADFDDGSGSRAEQKTLAKLAECSVKTVGRAIKALVYGGWILETGEYVVREKRYKSGKIWQNRTKVYQINIEKLAA